LTLVEADLLKKDTVIAAIAGAKYVVHTASPVPMDMAGANESKLVPPALEGTKAVLEGCKMAGTKRLVITSSVAAIGSTNDTR
jgi:nucleoside-diphosphate-sugar epimerase